MASLCEAAGHEVIVIDPVLEIQAGSLPGAALVDSTSFARYIEAIKPDLVGFSTTITSYPVIVDWAEALRQICPNATIVFGGPQASATDEETLVAFPWVDMILRGEAENSIVPLINCLQSGGDLELAPGLSWRRGGKFVRNPDAPVVTDLDALPFPAYHLYPVSKMVNIYNTRKNRTVESFPLETGRGCPFRCTFCSTASFYKRRLRMKSAGRLVREMSDLHNKYGLDQFFLIHDLLTGDRPFVLEFCNMLRLNGLAGKVSWECFSRIDTVDKDMLRDMAEAGCKGIFYGIETGSERIQQLVKKKINLNKIDEVVKETLNLGIQVATPFLCGYPGETRTDVSATLDRLTSMVGLGVEKARLKTLIPMPGSELFERYSDTLCSDGAWADIPFGYLDNHKREIVLRWPRLFSSFFHFDVPDLNYDSLRGASVIVDRYWLLLAALKFSGVDLFALFEHWAKELDIEAIRVAQSIRPNEIFLNFLYFLKRTLNVEPTIDTRLNDIVQFHIIIENVLAGPENAPLVMGTFTCDPPVVQKQYTRLNDAFEISSEPSTYIFWKKALHKRVK